MMQDFVKSVVASRWFKDESPFRCKVKYGHPKLCVITGPNTSGKSIIRRILFGKHQDKQIEYIPLSQAGRARSGIQRAFVYGSEEDESTGKNSIQTMLTAFRTGHSREKPFSIMFDEPEIGCSEELQAGIGQYIADEFESMKNLVGLFIITHGRHVVKPLLRHNPTHWRLTEDGLSLYEWVHREVVPVPNLQELIDNTHDKWRQVQKMIKDK